MSVLQKNKKAAIGIGVAALAVAGLALGTGTYAAFTDTEAGPGGTLAAGTIALNVSSTPTGLADVFDVDGIYPGLDIAVKTVTVKNTGTLNGKLTGKLVVAPNAGGELQDQLKVTVACGAGETAPTSGGQTLTVAQATQIATGFINSNQSVPLAAGQSATCSFKFALPDGPDNNKVQGDKIDISSEFTLTQA